MTRDDARLAEGLLPVGQVNGLVAGLDRETGTVKTYDGGAVIDEHPCFGAYFDELVREAPQHIYNAGYAVGVSIVLVGGAGSRWRRKQGVSL